MLIDMADKSSYPLATFRNNMVYTQGETPFEGFI